MKIWKYVVKMDGMTELLVPEGAELVTAGLLNGDLCVWAIVDPAEAKTARKVLSVWTGNEAGNVLKYLGIFNRGPLVYHVVEVS